MEDLEEDATAVQERLSRMSRARRLTTLSTGFHTDASRKLPLPPQLIKENRSRLWIKWETEQKIKEHEKRVQRELEIVEAEAVRRAELQLVVGPASGPEVAGGAEPAKLTHAQKLARVLAVKQATIKAKEDGKAQLKADRGARMQATMEQRALKVQEETEKNNAMLVHKLARMLWKNAVKAVESQAESWADQEVRRLIMRLVEPQRLIGAQKELSL